MRKFFNNKLSEQREQNRLRSKNRRKTERFLSLREIKEKLKRERDLEVISVKFSLDIEHDSN